jgi:hypothetical protein
MFEHSSEEDMVPALQVAASSVVAEDPYLPNEGVDTANAKPCVAQPQAEGALFITVC